LGRAKPGWLRVGVGATLIVAIATAGIVALIIANELISVGTDLANWDWLLVTGCLTFIGGLWLARGQPNRFADMLTRLENREVFQVPQRCDSPIPEGELTTIRPISEDQLTRSRPISEDELTGIRHHLAERTQKFELWTVIAFATALVGAWIYAEWSVELLLIELPMALVAGWYVGRFLGSSRLPSVLEHNGVTVRALPGHVDGAAGLKPLGSYFFYQAFVLALPATFLMVWSLLFLIPREERIYPQWRGPYLGLLAVAIGVEILGFVAPLWRTHKTMSRQKQAELIRADSSIAPRIAGARAELAQELDPAKRSGLHGLIDDLTGSYHELEAMPTWPVDRTLVRRLTIGNLVLIVPLVTQVITATGNGIRL
jgi:hypothetical protein